MPIKPRPFTFVCEDCKWKKTIAPRSDALMPGDWFASCPKCGSTALKMRAAGWLEAALAELRAAWFDADRELPALPAWVCVARKRAVPAAPSTRR